MEHILRNVLMALLEQPDATLHDVLRIFSDNEFRKRIASSLRNDTVSTFLLKEFERFSFGYRRMERRRSKTRLERFSQTHYSIGY